MSQKKSNCTDGYCLDEKEWLSPQGKKNKKNPEKNKDFTKNKARLISTNPGVYFLNSS